MLCLNTTPLAAESLQVSVLTTVAENFPELTEEFVQAFSGTDLNATINYFPPSRSLALLHQGKVAIEFFRTPSVMSGFPDVLRLEPPVRELTFIMITSAKTPELCSFSEREYADLSSAGLLGVGLYESDFYPLFKENTTLLDVHAITRFIALQRADVSFLPQELLYRLSDEARKDLSICDKKLTRFAFYAYLHKDFAWARAKLEAVLQQEFGSAVTGPIPK